VGGGLHMDPARPAPMHGKDPAWAWAMQMRMAESE
jgi:hypothetical protein